MDIKNSVAPVTGAHRGVGRHFATQLLERGAKATGDVTLLVNNAGALREELAPRGVALTSLLMGWMSTDLAGFIPDDQPST